MDELEENPAQWTHGDLFWITGLVLPKQKDFFSPQTAHFERQNKTTLVTHAQEYSQIIHVWGAEQQCNFGLTNCHPVPTSRET